jgi:endo-1,4-beta-xylanase
MARGAAIARSEVMLRRRFLGAGLASLLPMAAMPEDGAGRSLRDAAAARNIRFGSEVTLPDITNDPAYARLIAAECAIITPGLEAKWGFTEPAPGQFRFGPMDALAAFAKRNRLGLHMHNLIWSVALPRWTVAAIAQGTESAIMARHIAMLVGRYQDQVESWDVINEPADPRWPSGPEGLCNTPWRKGLGPAYVDEALRDARAANPRVQLMINDDDLEYDAPDRDRKRQIYLNLVADLKKRRVPLGGFGLEAHLKPWRQIAEARYRRFLRDLADMGLTLSVTELDVCDRSLPAEIGARDAAVAAFTKRYLDLVLDEPATRTVITWGLSDRSTWMLRDPAGQRPDGLPPRPSPYDSHLQPKPMRAALLAAFAGARERPA